MFPSSDGVQTVAGDTPDDSLSTHEAAVECVLSQIVEVAAAKHQPVGNPQNAAFKAGLCAGKIQTYMLGAAAAQPDCFPKLDLEEGISMFVKWAEAHPADGALPYPEGLKKAFEDAVPCLKK